MSETLHDEVLEALAMLINALESSRHRVEAVYEGAKHLRQGRSHGLSYAELLSSVGCRGVIDGVSDLLDGLVNAGSRLRHAEARALRAEGLSLSKVGAVLGVSRQRASALLEDVGGDRAVERSGRR
ncbi:MAG TPA: hypothetical protein VGC84_00295 [Ilumatobacteraceae bacterium]|jgi:hypothetical protein